jgi:hypothetical protein
MQGKRFGTKAQRRELIVAGWGDSPGSVGSQSRALEDSWIEFCMDLSDDFNDLRVFLGRERAGDRKWSRPHDFPKRGPTLFFCDTGGPLHDEGVGSSREYRQLTEGFSWMFPPFVLDIATHRVVPFTTPSRIRRPALLRAGSSYDRSEKPRHRSQANAHG